MKSKLLSKNVFIFLILVQSFCIVRSAVLALESAKTVASIFCASKVRKAAGQAGAILIIKGLRQCTQNNDPSSKDRNKNNFSMLDWSWCLVG